MDWGYVAGYFDGEGHVSLALKSRGDKTRGLGWYNTHVESLNAIRDFMGVGRVRLRAKSSGLGTKPAYELCITSKVALLHVLEHMIPHLIIKRSRAEELRDYLMNHVNERRMEHFGKVASVSTEQLRAWYHDEGKSQSQIAKLLGGVTPSCITQAFKLRGIEARKAGGDHQKGVQKSPETRARMQAARKALWADPAFRARQVELREQNRETRLARMSEGQRKRWADPEYREQMKAKRKAQWANPDVHARMSEAQRMRRAREAAQRVGV